MTLGTFFRTFYFYSSSFLLLLILSPLILLSLLVSCWARFSWCFAFVAQGIYKSICFFLPVPLSIKGSTLAFPPHAIIVANHQSFLDIPLVGSCLPLSPHLWLYKYELDSIPVLNFLLSKIGVPIARSSLMDGMRALATTLKKIKEMPGYVIIFPEGGRFTDGAIHPFYAGFALLAEKTKYPVIPIYIHNTGTVAPPGSFLLHYAPLTVVVGEPIRMEENEDITVFSNRVKEWFILQEKQCYVL